MLTCGSLSTPAASAPVLVQSLFRSGHSNNIEGMDGSPRAGTLAFLQT